MPLKLIKVDEEKRKVVKLLILICVILMIAAMVVTTIYLLGYDTDADSEVPLQFQSNDTAHDSLNDTSNEIKNILTSSDADSEVPLQFQSNDTVHDSLNDTSNEIKNILTSSEKPIQLQLNDPPTSTEDATNETDDIIASVLPRPEVHFTYYANLTVVKTTIITTNLSTVFNDNIEYLKLLGMKWCTLNIEAPLNIDFGTAQEADRCVEEHDHCAKAIPFGETKRGLKNLDICKRSYCSCDQQFYKCLKNNHDLMSDMVGFIYFTFLGPKCYAEDYPIIRCMKCEYTALSYEKVNRRRCTKYEFSKTAAKKYQWFDNPIYF